MSRRRDNYENSRWMKFKRWVDGETDPLAGRMEARAYEDKKASHSSNHGRERLEDLEADTEEVLKRLPIFANGYDSVVDKGLMAFRRMYKVMSVLLCAGIIAVLLWTVSYLPVFGDAKNPDNNEVSARYIEKGLQETGAVNIVTGMILDYRAFDTFGESNVLRVVYRFLLCSGTSSN